MSRARSRGWVRPIWTARKSSSCGPMPRLAYAVLAVGTFAFYGSLAWTPWDNPSWGEDIAWVDLGKLEGVDSLRITGGEVFLETDDAGKRRLVFRCTDPQGNGTIAFPAGDGAKDLSGFRFVAAALRNTGNEPLRVQLSARATAPKGRSLSRSYELQPGEEVLLRLTLRRTVPESLSGVFFGMRGFPALMDPERGIDVSRIIEVSVGLRGARGGSGLIIEGIEAREPFQPPDCLSGDRSGLFPLIDSFGQYRHADWVGKTKSVEDLRSQLALEFEELEKYPGPGNWNQYGGWTAGPQLEATGHFRVEKYGDRWWLVDPAGRLFWSHGVDCVRVFEAITPLDDRRHWFEELPEKDSPLGQFYGRASWAPHGYYQNKGTYETYCFFGANLFRKYGEEWRTRFAELTHRRLRSWGLNTIGNWSDPAIYHLGKTPYVVTANTRGPRIEGSSGYWGKFPDPFAEEFDFTLKRDLDRHRATSAQDPWCLGFFVDNELSWGDEFSLAIAALQSPPEQPAKKAFLEYLRSRYDSIDRLNAAWGTKYDSWEALRMSTEAPDRTKAAEDLGTFYTQIAEEYFRRCREAVKSVAPAKLYLGCRFAWGNPRATRAAAKYCDVVSFNRYDITLRQFRLPEGLDCPVIVGEFHFGALDRGMFHTGLQETADQQDRAEAYRRYVLSGLSHPTIVGTHWFQLTDQATTGRGDGENYQIGFLDVCDRPYGELVAASRWIGEQMYVIRAGSASK